MKIDIYTLLGMIKDGKAPKKIMYKNRQYELNDNNEYHCQDKDLGLFEYLFSMYYTDEVLNDEVEILETTITIKDDKFTGWEAETKCDDEKNLLASNKIEKLEIDALGMLKDKNNSHIISIIDIVDKINEIIDYIQKD